MNYKNQNFIEKLKKINSDFYTLISELKEEKFNFCAYVIEDAYRFYAKEVEKRLFDNNIS